MQLSDITDDNPYMPSKHPIYATYSLKKLDQEEAIKEDIKALALILYELSLESHNENKLTLSDEYFKNKKGKLDFYKITKNKFTMLREHSLKDILDKMLLSNDDITYDDILSVYPTEIYPYVQVLNAEHTLKACELFNINNDDENIQEINYILST